MLGWTQLQVETLNNPFLLEPLIAKGIALRKIWMQQGFSAFFQSFLISSWQHNGANVAENILSRENGILLYHCIQQIAEILIEREVVGKLSPHRLFDALEEIRLLEKTGDQQLKQRANPEKEGVRILTIHSSKGLEFEIVFALGVITRSKPPSCFVPVSDNSLPLLTAVADSNDPRYIQYAHELDAEKIRQLYVAFTRAKQRLYVPVFFQSTGKNCEFGTASPMELYLSMMGNSEILFSELYSQVNELNSENILNFIQTLGNSQSITLSTSADPLGQLTPENSSTTVQLQKPAKPNIKDSPSFMHSFTALSTSARDDDYLQTHEPTGSINLKPPSNFECIDKTAHTLPAGALTGTMLHSLMENIPFETATLPELSLLIEKFLKNTSFEEWNKVIVDIIFQALSTPLTIGDSVFYLNHLSPAHCYREHEFLYPANQEMHPDLAFRPGYMQGIIDLIFKHEDKYCIIDWKSNWLGPDNSYYNQIHLENAMHSHDYFLQAKIYKEALKRYLKLIDQRPFEEIFGGIFYIFMRGLDDGNGIFKIPR